MINTDDTEESKMDEKYWICMDSSDQCSMCVILCKRRLNLGKVHFYQVLAKMRYCTELSAIKMICESFNIYHEEMDVFSEVSCGPRIVSFEPLVVPTHRTFFAALYKLSHHNAMDREQPSH